MTPNHLSPKTNHFSSLIMPLSQLDPSPALILIDLQKMLVATMGGVESTAGNAHDHGYNVGLVVDAMTDRDPDAHRNSIEKIFPCIGETTTTDEVLSQLQEQTRSTNFAVHQ
jgi:Isochorismatase family